MKNKNPNLLLILAAALCLLETVRLPKNDPGPLSTGILGGLCLLKGLGVRSLPLTVIVSVFVLSIIAVAGDEAIININTPLWAGLIGVSAAVILWEAIRLRFGGAGKGAGKDDLK